MAVVEACRGDLHDVVVAEVVMLAPAREAILYVLVDRVVVVAVTDCTQVAVLRG